MYIDTRDVTVTITDVVVDYGMGYLMGLLRTVTRSRSRQELKIGRVLQLYPRTLVKVAKSAAIPDGGVDTNIRFVFEANPYPNNTPRLVRRMY